jgi:hypothetical protein
MASMTGLGVVKLIHCYSNKFKLLRDLNITIIAFTVPKSSRITPTGVIMLGTSMFYISVYKLITVVYLVTNYAYE